MFHTFHCLALQKKQNYSFTSKVFFFLILTNSQKKKLLIFSLNFLSNQTKKPKRNPKNPTKPKRLTELKTEKDTHKAWRTGPAGPTFSNKSTQRSSDRSIKEKPAFRSEMPEKEHPQPEAESDQHPEATENNVALHNTLSRSRYLFTDHEKYQVRSNGDKCVASDS